ncbi:hypothetical protein ACHAXT_012487 [Thalassiosira profunda]
MKSFVRQLSGGGSLSPKRSPKPAKPAIPCTIAFKIEAPAPLEYPEPQHDGEARHADTSDAVQLKTSLANTVDTVETVAEMTTAEHTTLLSNSIESLSAWDAPVQERMASLSNTITSLLDSDLIDASARDEAHDGWSEYSFGSARRRPIQHFLWRSAGDANGPIRKLDEMCFEQVVHLMIMSDRAQAKLLNSMLNRGEF